MNRQIKRGSGKNHLFLEAIGQLASLCSSMPGGNPLLLKLNDAWIWQTATGCPSLHSLSPDGKVVFIFHFSVLTHLFLEASLDEQFHHCPCRHQPPSPLSTLPWGAGLAWWLQSNWLTSNTGFGSY